MKFKNFLVESGDFGTVSVEEDGAIDWARKNAMNNMQHPDPVIVRGMHYKKPFSIANPSTHRRTSKNTSNEYTTLLSNLDEWKEFPKRNESLICGTMANKDYASDFGQIYIVIPCDTWKTQIGVAPDHDLWFSFQHLSKMTNTRLEDPAELNHFLRRLMSATISSPIPASNSSIDDLLSAFDKITELLRSDPTIYDKVLGDYELPLDDVKSGRITLTDWVTDALHPTKNSFELMTYEQLAKITYEEEREIWLSNNCVMLSAQNGFTASYAEIRQTYIKFRKKVLA